MSWFDPSGFANLAKSALKEAQKTIDKALDIKDDSNPTSNWSKESSPAAVEAAEADSFFASWGLKAGGEKDSTVNIKDAPVSPNIVTASHEGPPKSSKLTMSTSLWGSFTGSFFDNPRKSVEDLSVGSHEVESEEGEDPVSKQPKKVILFPSHIDDEPDTSEAVPRRNSESDEAFNSIDREITLCDDTSDVGADEHFSSSKLVVESEEIGVSLLGCETNIDKVLSTDNSTLETTGYMQNKMDCKSDILDKITMQVARQIDALPSNIQSNRFSVISSESDKKSSESVEVLGYAGSDGGSGCTTSPDSDFPLVSPKMSASSSCSGLKLSTMASSPESVEVIPDTPSSVEVLCDELTRKSSKSTLSSPYVSPVDPSIPPDMLSVLVQNVLDNRGSGGLYDGTMPSKLDKISPESVEVIPEEEDEDEDEDVSVADDSYTSASESTATVTTTVMEQISLMSRTEGCEVSKSPLHISKNHSANASSSENSLYSSTISSKAETSEVKSPSSKILHQNLSTVDSPFSENSLISDLQLSLPSEGPALTHSSSRSGLQLSLLHIESVKSCEFAFEEGQSEKEVKGRARTPVNKQSVQLSVSNAVSGVFESSNEESSLLSDSRTVVNTDSSGEGTVMESSSEDAVVPNIVDASSSSTSSSSSSRSSSSSSSSSSTGDTKLSFQHSSSYYVKTMLADAIGEDDVKDTRIETLLSVREQSPISSESRSDMVKVESDQTSGHTSGDELETTTSSDIEIISSPNGDSSSTQSRQSPAKLLQRTVRSKLSLAIERSDSPGLDLLGKIGYNEKVKGHQGELSETSSGGSEDCHYLEMEKLLKRITEMTEILEARETKLVELSRLNVELQENNSELKNQLEAALLSRVAETQDMHQVTEEYTQRLSSLERKFQQAIRDKEMFRKQFEQAKLEVASRISLGDLQGMIVEKDEVIRELREEGEKLSKQQLQHSNIIKKLRAKEKENENTMKTQKEQLEEQYLEVERLKRSLTAKEEVERTQIEAVHQLTAKTKRLEKEQQNFDKQCEDMQNKIDFLKTSLDIAQKDLTESKKVSAAKDKEAKEAALSAELSVRQELLSAMKDAESNALEEREQLVSQVEELRLKLRLAEEQHSERETSIRKECSHLIHRVEQAEARNEELAQSVSVATRPLLRQLESLQVTNSTLQTAWEKQERHLTEMITELQERVASLVDQERSSREESINSHSRLSILESNLNSSKEENLKLQVELDEVKVSLLKMKEEKEKCASEALSLENALKEEVSNLKHEIITLEHQVTMEKAALEAEKRRTNFLQEQLREREHLEKDGTVVPVSPSGTPQSSPTLSFGHTSFTESMSSVTWPQFQDDALECSSVSGRLNNVYESLRSGNTTSLLEGLQAQLKLRDGEVQQLQWEMTRRDTEKIALTSELSVLTVRVEEQEQQLKEASDVKKAYEDIQHKYDALLQMYGEKVEETQELKLDLQDVKEMYKTQIDQLTKKAPAQ